MLAEYIDAALRQAKYELMEEDEGYFGTIPVCKGVWASAKTLDECRDELRSTLGDWILVKVRHGDNDLPVINRIDLNDKTKKSKVA